MPFQYHYEATRNVWAVTLDAYEIAAFPTEALAAAYCKEQNGEKE